MRIGIIGGSGLDDPKIINMSSSPKIGHSISRKWHDPLHTGECHEKKQAQ